MKNIKNIQKQIETTIIDPKGLGFYGTTIRKGDKKKRKK